MKTVGVYMWEKWRRASLVCDNGTYAVVQLFDSGMKIRVSSFQLTSAEKMDKVFGSAEMAINN